ncbi:unnamed protein product [Ceutorhynchus assimilis]|uniref:Uncharacterized protein n=1 Tax=Ceutorhynchus assimilis TaxID=467358 RepID=A0A9N9QS24_9CUCU|nr:unnamed protein product [Ceutorhynchus assimilis]
MANLPYKIVRILNEVRRSADQSINEMDKKIEHLSSKYDQVIQENAKMHKEFQDTIKSMQNSNQPPIINDDDNEDVVMETRARKRTGSVSLARNKTRESRSRSKVHAKSTRRRSRSALVMKTKRRRVAKKRSKRGKSRRRTLK